MQNADDILDSPEEYEDFVIRETNIPLLPYVAEYVVNKRRVWAVDKKGNLLFTPLAIVPVHAEWIAIPFDYAFSVDFHNHPASKAAVGCFQFCLPRTPSGFCRIIAKLTNEDVHFTDLGCDLFVRDLEARSARWQAQLAAEEDEMMRIQCEEALRARAEDKSDEIPW